MILKLHNRVPIDFTALQDKHQSLNVGFEPFDGNTLYGITFHQQSDSLPFEKMRSDITHESSDGRFVVVSTREPDGNYHIWIATEVSPTDVRASSKRFDETGKASPKGPDTTVEILLFQDRLNHCPPTLYLTYTVAPQAADSKPAC